LPLSNFVTFYCIEYSAVLILYSDVYAICDYMCLVDILGTHIVSAWFSLENWVRQIGIRARLTVG